MAVKDEVKMILKDVAKGLLSIPFPPAEIHRQDYILLHWCPQCKKHHRAS